MKPTYKDIDLNFNVHPVTGDLVKKTDKDAILQSIKFLVLTCEEEILQEPNIGGGVGKLLFNLGDGLLFYNVKQKVIETIRNHEPRCDLKSVEVMPVQNGDGLYVRLNFYILNNPTLITDTINLKRIR